MKHVTMQDIAQKAGVTKATVSMVINNDKRITEATRQKVLAIIKELNYYPNESARKLAKGKTNTIAFLAPRFGPPFISNILDAFENLAFRNDKFARGIQPYATRNQTAVLEELLKKVLYGREADAVVVLTQEPSGGMVREYLENQVPMVLIENEIAGVHSVRIDNVQGAYQATDYLAKKGRKNIGLVVGAMGTDPAWGANRSAFERLEGYQKALKDNGLEPDPARVVTVIQYEYGEGGTCAEQLLKKKNLDAVFCAAGDMVAMGLMEHMKKKGFRIPADISIIGYDDMIAARMLNPSLTTVRQSFGEIASIAFEMAVDSIDGKIKKEKHVVLAPELVLRESA